MAGVVDAHFHVWSPNTHPWLKNLIGGGHIAGDFAPIVEYSIEQYTSDAYPAGVRKAVYVETVWPGDPVGETLWLEDIARTSKYGFPQGVVAYCDLSAPNVETVLSQHSKYDRVKGIRQLLDYHPSRKDLQQAPHDNYLTDPAWQRGVGLLEKYNFSFDLHIVSHQMKRASQVIRMYPNVQFIVDHNGLPVDRDEEGIKLWREEMRQLSQYANVTVKLSGMAMIDRQWTADNIRPFLLHTIETVGPERCMFASNFPVDKVNADYSVLLEAVKKNIAHLPTTDQQCILATTAERVYRL